MSLNKFLLALNGFQTGAWLIAMVIIPRTSLGSSVLFVTEISLYALVLSSFIAAIVAYAAHKSEKSHKHLHHRIDNLTKGTKQ